MRHEIVLSSQVRLARNYEDIPFDVSNRPEFAAACISRTVNALKAAGADAGFALFRLRDLPDAARTAMAESRIISRDLLRTPETSAALIDQADGLSIMMNEDDHVRIQAIRPELDLLSAASACFRLDDALSRQVSFAFDAQLGYLTACPTNTGTGMRASLLMHLPMLTKAKQMGNVGQLVAKVGLNIRGVYGEGSEALGNLYLVSNQVTLGRTEQELISAVTAVGHQLTDMERTLLEKTFATSRITLEDTIFRAWGVMHYARVMPLKEFYRHWSGVRLGAEMGLLPVPVNVMDTLLEQCQDANLQVQADTTMEGTLLDARRALHVRKALQPYGRQ